MCATGSAANNIQSDHLGSPGSSLLQTSAHITASPVLAPHWSNENVPKRAELIEHIQRSILRSFVVCQMVTGIDGMQQTRALSLDARSSSGQPATTRAVLQRFHGTMIEMNNRSKENFVQLLSSPTSSTCGANARVPKLAIAGFVCKPLRHQHRICVYRCAIVTASC